MPTQRHRVAKKKKCGALHLSVGPAAVFVAFVFICIKRRTGGLLEAYEDSDPVMASDL